MCSDSFDIINWEDPLRMVRWPSGLRRQTKELVEGSHPLPSSKSGPKGRGFESHSHHLCIFATCTMVVLYLN